MNAYLVQLDLSALSKRLSRWLGCRLSVADVRDLLRRTGFTESDFGWLTTDVRPMILAYVRPGRPLFPALSARGR